MVAQVQTGAREFDLLCLAARPRAPLTQIRDLLDKVDNVALIDLAAEHGVRPSLLKCFSQLSWNAVPPNAKSALLDFRSDHALRSLRLAREVCRVAAVFAGERIPFVTFKGPALALVLYGGLADREYNDIDVMVPEEDVERAEGLLGSLGYRNTQGSPAFRQAFLSSQRQYPFVGPDGDVSIDLHWDLRGAHLPFPVQPPEIWNDLDRVSIGGQELPTVRGANLALVLAGHGTREAWHYLKWTQDFAMMVERGSELPWLAIHRRAARHGCGDAVLLGCAMARELLEVPVPAPLAGLLAEKPQIDSLSASIRAHMRDGSPSRGLKENFSGFALCDRTLDKVKAALTLALTPTVGDYNAMALPRALWPVYRVTRPFRLLAGALRRS